MNYLLMSITALFAALFGMQQKGDFQSVGVDDFATYIQQPDVQLVDVRTPKEFSESHLSGAKNIDVLSNDFTNQATQALSTDKPVAVYCRSGSRSKKAAGILSAKGYKVIDLNNGIMSWQAAGKPTTK